MVPNIEGVIDVSEKDCFDSRKKNWSSPGHDKIVNFWWKKLPIVVPIVFKIFFTIINHETQVERWFARGQLD